MNALSRIASVLWKDMRWAFLNLKILGLMILPLFLTVFFSRIGGSYSFSISISFVVSYVGIFLTSYLIIEEKSRGTLLALLTSPLQAHELLIAKFLFSFLISIFFAFVSAILCSRIDLVTNPTLLVHLVLASGMMCFLGSFFGLFVKNEQELGIFAPLFLMAFFMGRPISIIRQSPEIHGFFPDYHLMKIIESEVSLPSGTVFFHTLFGSVYLLFAFFIALTYTNFYFANSFEKRFTLKAGFPILCFLGVFGLSGIVSPILIVSTPSKTSEVGQSYYRFESSLWRVELPFDPKTERPGLVLETGNVQAHSIQYTDKSTEVEIGIATRKESGKSYKKREQEFVENPARTLVSKSDIEIDGIPFRHLIFLSAKNYVILFSADCGLETLRISHTIKAPDFKTVQTGTIKIRQVQSKLKLQCLSPSSETSS